MIFFTSKFNRDGLSPVSFLLLRNEDDKKIVDLQPETITE